MHNMFLVLFLKGVVNIKGYLDAEDIPTNNLLPLIAPFIFHPRQNYNCTYNTHRS